MMNSLKSLTFIPAPPKTPHNPRFFRRERLLQWLQEQLQLAKDPAFAPVVKRWKKGEDGVKRPVDHIRRVKPFSSTRHHGFVVLTVRYGFKTLELKKGKAAIAVGTVEKLEGVLSTLIAATRAGELDGLLEPVKRAEAGKAKKAARADGGLVFITNGSRQQKYLSSPPVSCIAAA